jgi:HPt (histidine-containing phosphotransfer) domain-containing protein
MATTSIPSPQASTAEELGEFRDALSDQMIMLERQIAQLRRDPRDKEAVAGLFRTLHTLKGDAAMCHFELGVKIAHPIETVLARLREGRLTFTPLLAEAILLATDRMELATEALLRQRPVENLNLDPLIMQLERLAASQADPLDAEAAALIEAVTGFRPSGAPAKSIPAAAVPLPDRGRDMDFFRELALLFEERKPVFAGRSGRQVHLALTTNRCAGTPVDPVQLEAAVYLHDIGMMLLPESIWLGNGAINEQGQQQLRRHTYWAAELLARMPGWQEAAKMVAQHHEMVDGRGYPAGLSDAQIVPGAKILAIIDAFESVMLKHSQRGSRRSLVRAIAEINASDQQFSTEWIGYFNQVVRDMVEH